jgi:hypothetical protein
LKGADFSQGLAAVSIPAADMELYP